MSADNGIYILKTRDQYRVAHLQSISNISWSAIDGDWQSNRATRGKYVPTRVVEMWGDCKYTKNADIALKIANKWAKGLFICEYGINVITYNKTWKLIVEDAKEYAKKEIEYLQNREKISCFYWDMQSLRAMADGKYFEYLKHKRLG